MWRHLHRLFKQYYRLSQYAADAHIVNKVSIRKDVLTDRLREND